MSGGNLEEILYDDSIIKVIRDDTSEHTPCAYHVTNEPYSLSSYLDAIDTETVVGIVGGGEQLLNCAKDPKVKRIIGVDINQSQIALCMGKISMCYDERSGDLMDASRKLWNDKFDLEKLLKSYRESTIESYGFEGIYESLGKRLASGDLKMTLIAGDALKVFPLMEVSKCTVYLSNLPDCIDPWALYKSLEKFLDSGSMLVLCELSSDYYMGKVGVFTDTVVSRRRYGRTIKSTFVGSGNVFDETVYILSPKKQF